MLKETILNEFLSSGISSDVFALNVQIVDDVEFDPLTKEAIATPIADALNFRYTRFGWKTQPNLTAALFIGEDGGAWQSKIFGEDAQQWLTQYQNQGKRTGRYMAPKGIGDKPYRPNIPRETINAIAAKYDLDPPENGLFWDWFIEHKEIPLLIAEGGKKALAAISQGKIALSLFGCNCGVHDAVVKPELMPYVEGRSVTIAFDRDEKPETRYKVFKATKRLGTAITRTANGKVAIAVWDGTQGKGIDDLIANDPALFHTAIETAQNFEDWKLGRIKDLTGLINQTVNQKYLDVTTPNNTQLICLKSPKGTGKTEWLAKQIGELINKGDRVIVLSHREQLVKELAGRFGLPYRTEIKLANEGSQLGYALCIDSLHPKANPSFNPDEWEGCSVVIDECEQVFWHLLNSSTCQRNRTAILDSFKKLVNNSVEHGGKIYLADADLSKISINYVQSLLETPVNSWVVLNEYCQEKKRIGNVYDSPESLMSDLRESVKNGDRVIVHTGAQKVSSQWGTINIESLLKREFPDKKILRIDAETVADPSHPAYGCIGNLNAVLPLYDVVIASPTIETGVSIDIDHFDRVFCFGTGTQTVEAVCQTLARVRADIPRHIWIKERSSQRIGNGSSDPYSLKDSQIKNFKLNLQLLAIADLVEDANPENLNTWVNFAAIHNHGFKNYRAAIYERLTNESYSLIKADIPDDSQEIKKLIKDLAEENHNEQCQKICEADNSDDLTLKKLQKQRAKTETERNQERKGNLTRRYLTDEITPELVKADEKGLYGQLQLHYFLTIGNDFLKKRDTEKVEKLSNEGKVNTPDLNHSTKSGQVAAMKAINIEQFLDSDREFTSDNLKDWLSFVLARRYDIKTYLNQTINPEKDTAIAVAQRLLSTMGLKLTCIGQRTINGKRQRVYVMADLYPDGRNEIFARWFERDSQLDHTPDLHTPSISINELKECA